MVRNSLSDGRRSRMMEEEVKFSLIRLNRIAEAATSRLHPVRVWYLKSQLASQNSRRRSVEHLRRLAKELLTARACKGDAQQERANLLIRRRCLMERCRKLHTYILMKLKDRGDDTELPTPWIPPLHILQHDDIPVPNVESTKPTGAKIPVITDNLDSKNIQLSTQNVFECRLEKLVQKSVSHLLRKEEEPKLVCAKTIFISEHNRRLDMKSVDLIKQYSDDSDGILNLSLKNNNAKRRSHGRKQTAPRRIAYVCNEPEVVLNHPDCQHLQFSVCAAKMFAQSGLDAVCCPITLTE
ncbi:hypothetical protein EVAR_43826_1 [Eumeta japonica]|uniref:Uncharacterized protein n=1 Tax=Eumeta variegata TaxID=151549 RepID=A0A4C1X129_EUMVA|nr:hypothetical protein EVAR_43826_1 [Eumeta japonica]